MKIVTLLIVCFSLFPSHAYAYLDPGTGSVLLSTSLAIFGAILYSLKSVYYNFFNKDAVRLSNADDGTLVIFSEGKTYWGTFRPIVTELIKRRIHFRYISLDLHDPALTISNEYMHSRLYLKSSWAFTRLTSVSAPVMLSTTPNIGSPGYPMKKSSDVENLVHVFHAVNDTSPYRLGALDFYDSVIMVGPHQEKVLREIEGIRQTQKKELVALGLPYLDDLYQQMPRDHVSKESTKTTILVAPSWGKKGCFTEYGVDFVIDLAKSGFDIIIRLHPQSCISEPEKVVQWQRKLAGLDNVIWDTELFAHRAMENSDVLISDTSSIRFDYAFLYSKPVITLEIAKNNQDEFESRYQETTWSERAASIIGDVVQAGSISKLPDIVKHALANNSVTTIGAFREQTVSNFGNSAPHIVNYILDKVQQSAIEQENEHV